MKILIDSLMLVLVLAAAVYCAIPRQACPAKGSEPLEWPVDVPAEADVQPLGDGCSCGCAQGGPCTCASCTNPAHAKQAFTDYAEAHEQAIRLKKPLLVVIHTQNCAPCKALDKTLESIDLSRFVVCRFDQDDNPRIVAALGIGQFPAMVVGGADDFWRATVIGSMDAAGIRRILDMAFQPPPPAFQAPQRPANYVQTAPMRFASRGC